MRDPGRGAGRLPGRGRAGRSIPAPGRTGVSSGAARLAEDLVKLQNELLDGLDSGSEEDSDQGAGINASQAQIAAFTGGEATGQAGAPTELTETAVLAVTGELKAEEVTHLVFRQQGLPSLATPGTVDFNRLGALEVLSLSHNKLKDIGPLSALSGLLEVNLNFNQIVDLGPLHECDQLLKLFVSHNEVETISGLDTGCPQLQELSLFANCLSDAQELMRTLGRLPEMRSLDIGENECYTGGMAQRCVLFRALPNLQHLDGQKLSRFELQLMDQAASGASEDKQTSPAATDAPLTRPGTAPAAGSRPSLQGQRPPPLPGGAQGAGAGQDLSLAHLPGQKLRPARSCRIDNVLARSRDASPDPAGRALPTLDTEQIDVKDPERTLKMLAVHAQALRRRLDILQIERENLRFQLRLQSQKGRESKLEHLQKQVESLEAENRNRLAIDSERKQLQRRLAVAERGVVEAEAAEKARAAAAADAPSQVLSTEAGPAPRSSSEAEDDDLGELRWENQLLEKRLHRLMCYGGQMHQDLVKTRLQTSHGRPPSSSQNGAAAGGGGAAFSSSSRPPRPLAHPAEEDAETDDPEIASMLASNEAMLRKLRGEVRDTATALARKGSTASEASAPEASASGAATVDVLRIGEGSSPDEEWHGDAEELR